MFRTLKHYGSVSLAYFKTSVLSTLEYPTGIMGWLLANPIQFLVGFSTIKFVVAEFGTIAGWGYGELAVLYGISVMSHALGVIFFIRCWYMGYYVIDGDFDRYMLRPMSVLYQFFFTEFNSAKRFSVETFSILLILSIYISISTLYVVFSSVLKL